MPGRVPAGLELAAASEVAQAGELGHDLAVVGLRVTRLRDGLPRTAVERRREPAAHVTRLRAACGEQRLRDRPHARR